MNLTNCINQRSCLKPYISPREALHRIFPSGNKRLRTRVFNLMHCKPVLISCSKLQTLKKDKINTIEGNSIKTWRSIVKSVEDGCRGPKAQQQYCAKHPAQRSRALQLLLPFFVLDFYFNIITRSASSCPISSFSTPDTPPFCGAFVCEAETGSV